MILEDIQEVESVVKSDESEIDKTEDDASFASEIIESENDEVSQKSISMGLNIPQIPDAVFLAPDVLDFYLFLFKRLAQSYSIVHEIVHLD